MDRILYNGINKYFNTLISYGYLNYNVINQLLVLLYIQELLGDYYIEYRTNIDSDIMNQVFNKIAVESTLFNLSSNTANSSSRYIYYGNSQSTPPIEEIINGNLVPYYKGKNLIISSIYNCVWFCCPSDIIVISIINNSFLGDTLLNKFSTQNVLINNNPYILYYYNSVIPLNGTITVNF